MRTITLLFCLSIAPLLAQKKWQSDPITDSYISSAATWNAKMPNPLSAVCDTLATDANSIPARIPVATSGVVYAKCYGAVEDGSTDDTAAILSAEAALPSTGGTVVVYNSKFKGHALRSNIRLLLAGTPNLLTPMMLRGGAVIEGVAGDQGGWGMNSTRVNTNSLTGLCSRYLPNHITGTAGTNTATLDSATGLAVNKYVAVMDGLSPHVLKITALSGLNVTFDANLSGSVFAAPLYPVVTGSNGGTTLTTDFPGQFPVNSTLSVADSAQYHQVTSVAGNVLTVTPALTADLTHAFPVCETPGTINLIGTQNGVYRLNLFGAGPHVVLNGGNQPVAQSIVEHNNLYGSSAAPVVVSGAFEYRILHNIITGAGSSSIDITADGNAYFNAGLGYIEYNTIYNAGINIFQTSVLNLDIMRNTYESLVQSPVRIDTSYGGSNAVIRGINFQGNSNADAAPPPSVIEDVSPTPVYGRIYDIYLRDWSETGGSGYTVSLCSPTIECVFDGYGSTSGDWILGAPRNYAMYTHQFIDVPNVSGTYSGPMLNYYTSLAVPQDSASWSFLYGTTGTLSSSIAPDGSNTATTVHCTSSTCSLRIVQLATPTNLTVGDYLIVGFYGKSPDTTKSFNTYGSRSAFSTINASYDTGEQISPTQMLIYNIGGDELNRIGGGWGMGHSVFKVTAVTDSPTYVELDFGSDQNSDFTVWMPFIVRIPAGTMQDAEVYSFARLIRGVINGVPVAGSLAMYPHQSLYIGNDVNLSRQRANVLKSGTSFQVAATSSDPTCTTTAHIGTIWIDNTTTTTAYKVCLAVSGTVQWVTK